MQRIGHHLIPNESTKSLMPPLSILEKIKIRYFNYLIKRCNRRAEKFGKSSGGIDQLVWNAAVSKRASYYYRVQALYLKAELRELSKYGQ
jgi:hypothetical protein